MIFSKYGHILNLFWRTIPNLTPKLCASILSGFCSVPVDKRKVKTEYCRNYKGQENSYFPMQNIISIDSQPVMYLRYK